jgi:hypothetical protein
MIFGPDRFEFNFPAHSITCPPGDMTDANDDRAEAILNS